jgi:hypothetical protein
MRLLVLGDTHGNLASVARAIRNAQRYGCEAIVQVGDWSFTWPGLRLLAGLEATLAAARLPMYFLDGNHEGYPDLIARGILGSERMEPVGCPWITYLPRGLVWEWDGVRFLALGGAFSVDIGQRTPGADWWPEETISFADMERTAAHLGALAPLDPSGRLVDVMLTHECPEGVPDLEEVLLRVPLPEDLAGPAAAQRRILRRVADVARPRLLCHGHHHRQYIGTLAGTDYRCEVYGLDCEWAPTKNFVVLDTRPLGVQTFDQLEA